MRPERLAILKWARADGGALFLPHALQYTGLSRFPDDGPDWPQGAHSIVCQFDTPPSEGPGTSAARLTFLADTAPHDRLQPGRQFELYHGTRQVATVELLW